MSDHLEVWIDTDIFGSPHLVGRLYHDRGQVRFAYESSWIKNPAAFLIDPDLSLDSGSFYPKPDSGNFGVFLDSSPDRWGQTLMKRREAIEAKDTGRKPRNLYAWDFLIGVQDETRQGALRFKRPGEETFLATDPLPAPPVTSLAELESIAVELSSKRLDNLDLLRRWLSVLVAPGASLGGARPKANFRDIDGSLWIAKFPARDDVIDVGAWEYVAHQLSMSAGINVPAARLVRLGNEHRTFCIKRFDRENNHRVFYSSAMTLMNKTQSEGSSYLDIASFIQSNGVDGHIKNDLEQLFRRVVFNVLIGNRDDHLRNHGFILKKDGWILSPAFDVNPNIDKQDHVLNLDEIDNRPNLDSVLHTHEWYGLGETYARRIVDEVISALTPWQQVAERCRVSRSEIELMAAAFSELPNQEETVYTHVPVMPSTLDETDYPTGPKPEDR